jgi:hypothetical protein
MPMGTRGDGATFCEVPPMTPPSVTELAGPLRTPAAGRRLANRACLVVGATSGIGRATALRMAEEGAGAVMVAGRWDSLGRALADELRLRGAESLVVTTDVTREPDVAELVEQTMVRCGRLDAVFNNAGYQERRARLAEQAGDVYARSSTPMSVLSSTPCAMRFWRCSSKSRVQANKRSCDEGGCASCERYRKKRPDDDLRHHQLDRKHDSTYRRIKRRCDT